MKPKWRIVISAVVGFSVIFALEAMTGGQLRNLLHWSLPLVEKIFPPLDSGPSPDAMLGDLVIDALLATIGISALLSYLAKRKKPNSESSVSP